MRNAFRNLVRSPGLSIVTIVTLALGIGLNTSMFSLMNLLLFQPLPYPDKDQLVRIYRTTPQSQTAGHTAPDYLEFKRAVAETVQVAAYRLWSFSLAQPDRPAVNLNAVRVSADFFPILGLPPELGRYFTPDEDQPGSHVIVLSHGTWQSQFGGDPAVIGRTVRVDGEPTTIIGVTPPSLSSLFLWGPGDAFRPLAFSAAERLDQNDTAIAILARMKPGETVGRLNGQLAAIVRTLAATRPSARHEDGLRAVVLQETTTSTGSIGISWLLVGLAGFVLLIACANLANLQLARTIARAQEFAVRAALGASRLRMIQPVLTECLLLSLAGGGLGVLVALWANDWLSGQLSANGIISLHVALDWRVLGFALGVSVVTGLIFGLTPAFVISRLRVNDVLKSGTRGNTGGRVQARLRHGLIVVQFALALMLLAAAGGFIRAVDRMLTRDIGWDHHSIIQGIITLPAAKYSTPEKTYSFCQRLQERLSTLPHVEQATLGWTLPVFQFLTTRAVIVAGREPPPAGREPIAYYNGVMPSYLPTLKIKLLAGRNFTEADVLGAPPVAIINESMARALFPNQNPIGQRIGNPDPDNPTWAEVVGVMPDLRLAISVLTPTTQFQVFRPLGQEPWKYLSFAIRVPGAARMADQARRTITELDPDIPVQQFSTIDDLTRLSGTGFGMISTLLVTFAVLGLLLSALGLYGVITRLVAQRQPELGVRIALGAQGHDIIWLILQTGIRVSILGTVLGLVGSFLLARIVTRINPDLPVQDPTMLAAVAALLVIVALVACTLPARRATKVDPLIALRSE